MRVTDEELEQLAVNGAVWIWLEHSEGDWMLSDRRLSEIAPALARELIAARKVVEAARKVSGEAYGFEHSFQTDFHANAYNDLMEPLTEYAEATK